MATLDFIPPASSVSAIRLPTGMMRDSPANGTSATISELMSGS